MILLASLDEVTFHQVEKIVILLRIDSRILDDQQTVSLERLCYLFAILLPALISLQVSAHIDRRYFKI